MTLHVLRPCPYTFLPSGLLLVEPHGDVLTARRLLLAAADDSVDVSEWIENEAERGEEVEVVIAILSESLGRTVLSGVAALVRRNWPRARILIFGRDHAAIEDNLYDARIDQRAAPEELLAALLMLTEYPRNQKATPGALLMDDSVSRLADDSVGRLFDGGRPGRFAETDSMTRRAEEEETTFARDLPGGERRFRQAS